MVDFASLKKNRKKNLSALQQKMEETTSGKKKSYADEREWKPTKDKMGNGYAVIRFLPSQHSDTPWERLFSYTFKGPKGQWYWENCRTTIDEADPVAEYNGELWNAGEKDEARKQKRKLNFISNVLVIKDPANPENEGKVMIYKYPKTIFEMINSEMNPEIEDEEPMDPFDMWEGAPFRLTIRKDGQWPSYDKSKFAAQSPVADNDEEIKAIFEQTHDIRTLVAPDQFKSYDELKAKLIKVLDLGAKKRSILDEDEDTTEAPAEVKAKPSRKAKERNLIDEDELDSDENLDEFLRELEGEN